MESSHSYRILLVEDFEPLRRSYERTFTDAGYEVLSAESLATARGAISSPTLDVHAALLDYRLPDGTVGPLVQELLERHPLCRSAVVTGAMDDETALEAARCGAHLYLRKPETFPNLLAAVEATVRSTIDWRRVLGQPQSNEPGATTGSVPQPVGMDLQRAMARLGHIARLTHVETLVAWRLLWGDSNKRIAELIDCSERTAKYHVAAVLARTGAKTRNGLLRVLLEDAGMQDPWQNRGEPDVAQDDG